MTGPEIDWRARFERQVSDNIDSTAKLTHKLHEKEVELQQANQRIDSLNEQVHKLAPMGEKYHKLAASYDEEMQRAADKVREHANRTDTYRKVVARGKRRYLEGIIRDLQGSLNQYPENSLQTDIADARTFLEAQEAEQ